MLGRYDSNFSSINFTCIRSLVSDMKHVDKFEERTKAGTATLYKIRISQNAGDKKLRGNSNESVLEYFQDGDKFVSS